MTYGRLFEKNDLQLLSTRLKSTHLHWVGQLTRMLSFFLPHAILQGVLEEGFQTVEHPRLRFKDVLKRDLKDFNIEPSTWTTAAKTESVAWKD